jgi:3-oxoacyl-[acyl-carrier protein] reductase
MEACEAMSPPPRHAILFGGTGYVGQAVLRLLVARGVRVTFTYRRKASAAHALAGELGQRAVAIDLRAPAEIRALLGNLLSEPAPPDLFIHCATQGRPIPLPDVSDDLYDETQAVNIRSAFVACQALLPRFAERGGGGDVVLLTYLDGARPTPMPAHFALTQTAIIGLAQSLAKEYGNRGVRINAVQVGPLQDGVARDLPLPLLADFERLSAIGRVGTAEEIARAIVFVALENSYMTGQVFPVQGGL